ncbi:MAG: ATP-binding protein [Owenweeksia sp.]|nr:ATP-binding protein [Owenweeksia sp.]
MIDRSKELEQLYDLVMTRQSVMLYAPSGMGKSHLLSQLYSRLEGRRFCFIFSLRGLQNERQLLRHILDNLLDKAADSYNLQYQLKRVLEERPAPLEVTAESLAGWLKNILVGLQNVSLDFLFVFEDAEQWEGRAPVVELLEALFKARNSQGLLTAAIPIKSLIEEVTPYRLSPITMENLSEKLRQSHPDETLQKTLEISGGNTRFFIELTRSEALQEGLPEEGLREVLENYHPFITTSANASPIYSGGYCWP